MLFFFRVERVIARYMMGGNDKISYSEGSISIKLTTINVRLQNNLYSLHSYDYCFVIVLHSSQLNILSEIQHLTNNIMNKNN